MADESKKNGNSNVNLIEPNDVNINTNVINGISQYQDMHIFAELTAKSKERTIIIDGNTSSKEGDIINFLGNNQDIDNPNHLNFTTNYYDGSTDNGIHYEGFGITNIKITTNSSFIPQVNIQFVDIRGLAFFNQTDSPYRMLFDFPPPIFRLTIKGQYGKPVSYDLHLVKYASEFSASNGNFIIDAQFVAVTFAPLTDILFRYVVNTSLIGNTESLSPNPKTKPKNTFELILQLKNLYSATSELLDTENENNKSKIIKDNLAKIDLIMEILEPKYIKKNTVLEKGGEPYLVMVESDGLTKETSVSNDNMVEVKDLTQINSSIKLQQSSGEDSVPPTRIIIVYPVGTNYFPETSSKAPSAYEYSTEDDIQYKKQLIQYRDILFKYDVSTLDFEENVDIIDPESFINSTDFLTNKKTNTKYYGMEITTFYTKLYHEKTRLLIEESDIAVELTTKINAMTAEELGMKPSIYNIFEIILNDVDEFFRTLRRTTVAAFESHNKEPNKSLLLNDLAYNESKEEGIDVYSFPLIINTTSGKQSRVSPKGLTEKGIDFPELKLVTDFIKTFGDQTNYADQFTKRDNKNDDGVNDWIPISPFDSKLGGASAQSPYIEANLPNEILKILLTRFYVLSQGTLTESFYPTSTNNNNNKLSSGAYINLYAEAEAINLASTLVNEKKLKSLTVMSDKYSKSVESFYIDIEKITDYSGTTNGSLYDFPINDTRNFPVGNGEVYTDKYNSEFKGVKLNISKVKYQGATSKQITEWKDTYKGSNCFKQNGTEYYFDFTNENLIYLRDKKRDLGESSLWNNIFGNDAASVNIVTDVGDNIRTFTRYLTQGDYVITRVTRGQVTTIRTEKNDDYPGTRNDTDAERQLIGLNEGNISFETIENNKGRYLDKGQDIIQLWSYMLGTYDDILIDTITGSKKLSSVLLLSNFGYTASPFNIYNNSLNSVVFDNTGVIEVPKYYPAYIGALLSALDDDEWYDDIVKFFTEKAGKELDNLGFYVLADLHDVNLYLSDYDKELFIGAYNTYMVEHSTIVDYIEEMYIGVNNETVDVDKPDIYYYYLNPNADDNKEIKDIDKGHYFSDVLSNLIRRTNMINYSQITFKMSEDYNLGYTSIKTLNDSEEGKEPNKYETVNKNYFEKFFTELKNKIEYIERKNKGKKDELKKISGDDNIINQLYYSFKNINDKWLTGSSNSNELYPFNREKKRLIDSFAFVDRGMNPIGETIINGEILTNMLEDPDISLFTVLSQLLSLNGFEFFPLQNFLSFENKDWEESFKIYNGGYDDEPSPCFVCMYVGGSSSYPSVSNGGFQNDGIINIEEANISGFYDDGTATQYEENVKQLEENKEFPFRQVRAFKVRFGEQNQSMFTDMKIDSKEYPETNESIQILSRLAGDNNPDAKVPIGQNLYNLYENRSYKATVTGFGNAMIQPTQYFQLENIPLFNGAYIILDVEHNIIPNKMTTSFSGTKLLEYPIPRILEANAITNYDGKTGADAVKAALDASNESTNVETDRLTNSKEKGGLESELGVDVSHWNGNCDWTKAKNDDVTFAIIKLTEGKTVNDYQYNNYDLNKNITDALDNDIMLTYYHFAKFGRTSNPETDAIDDANNFLDILGKIPDKPKMPVVLDIEEKSYSKKFKWRNRVKSINTYVETFINTMEDNGYDIMIYSRTDLIIEWDLTNYSKYPFWVARYMHPNSGIDTREPQVPKGWKWTAWQFTSKGLIGGVELTTETIGKRDLNVMKKDFLDKYR